MLSADTPFPFAGSLCLYRDPALEAGEARPELARIDQVLPDGVRLIGLPLRLGAAGTKRVALADLIDGTPLSKDEERELADLARALRNKSRRRKALLRRVEALRGRAMWSICLRSERAKLAAINAGHLPRRAVGEDGRAMKKEAA